jgi:hypothetical protein
MVKRTCACSLESGARRAPAARMARALNGLNLNRGRRADQSRSGTKIANPQTATGRGHEENQTRSLLLAFWVSSTWGRGPNAICVAREPRRSLIHARGHARALGTDGLRVSHVGTNRPRRPRSDCRRDSLCHSLGERFPTFSGRAFFNEILHCCAARRE